MSKMKDKAGQGNKNPKSTAMTVGGGNLQAAIEKLRAKGFEAAEETAERVEVQGNVIQNKDLLCGVDMLIVNVRRKASQEFGGMMCIVTAMLRSKDVIVFTDGSTGILDELEGKAPTPDKPLLVLGGLRKSTYPRKKRDENGDIVYKTDRNGKVQVDDAGEPVPEFMMAPNGQPLMGTTYHLSGEVDVSQIQGLNRNAVGPNGRPQQARA